MAMASLNVFNAVISLNFFIYFFFLYIQFLMRGMKILILRMGMPIACTGLMEKMTEEYLVCMSKSFFQGTMTVVVQISLAKMSVRLMINRVKRGTENTIKYAKIKEIFVEIYQFK